jgi:hypothetical protein
LCRVQSTYRSAVPWMKQDGTGACAEAASSGWLTQLCPLWGTTRSAPANMTRHETRSHFCECCSTILCAVDRPIFSIRSDTSFDAASCTVVEIRWHLRFSRRWLWRMVSSGMLHRVALVRTYVSEELSASIIRMTRIGELGTLAVTGNRRALRKIQSDRFLSLWWRRLYVPPKHRFLQEPHAVTSEKTPFFIVTAVKTSNFT